MFNTTLQLLYGALIICNLAAAQMSTTTELLTTYQQFLYLPSIASLSLVMATDGGFANQHITVLNAFGLYVPEATISSPVPASLSSTTSATYTPLSNMGSLVFAYNETFYTHNLWLYEHLPGDSASYDSDHTTFTDAYCTAQATANATWDCTSKTIRVSTYCWSGKVSDVPCTATNNILSTALVAQDFLYTVVVGPDLLLAPSPASSTTATFRG